MSKRNAIKGNIHFLRIFSNKVEQRNERTEERGCGVKKAFF
jgi:hypothetical protein